MSADRPARTPWHRLADAAEVANISLDGLSLLAAALYAAGRGSAAIERMRERCTENSRRFGLWGWNRVAERYLGLTGPKPWMDDRAAVMWARWPVVWADRAGIEVHPDRVEVGKLDGVRTWRPERSEMVRVLRWIGDGGLCGIGDGIAVVGLRSPGESEGS